MSPLQVAQIFNVYLMDLGALKNIDGSHGPFELRTEEYWQLDPSNDFRLRLDEDGTALLTCRYPGTQEKKIEAMAQLFHLSYPPRVRSPHAKKEVATNPEPLPVLMPGTQVKTMEPNMELRGEWTEEGWASKKPGVNGVIIKHHDSHGLCYDVQHEDGSIGCYDPSELEIIPE